MKEKLLLFLPSSANCDFEGYFAVYNVKKLQSMKLGIFQNVL